MTPTAAAESVPAELLHAAIRSLGITHIVTVPDTHQKTLLARLFEDPEIRVVTLSTEDDAIGVTAGLYMGGAVPMMIIQQLGVFASINSLRGIALDMNVPTLIMAGLFGRDVSKSTAENRSRSVRLVEPLLDSLEVPHYAIDGAGDVGLWFDRGHVVVHGQFGVQTVPAPVGETVDQLGPQRRFTEHECLGPSVGARRAALDQVGGDGERRAGESTCRVKAPASSRGRASVVARIESRAAVPSSRVRSACSANRVRAA